MSSKVETKSNPVNSGAPTTQPAAKGLQLLLTLLLILAIFVGATYFAFNQRPRPHTYTQSTAWESFYYPQEKNAFMRLPTINGSLNDIFVLPKSNKLWAVGNNGLIIYSPDGGMTWAQQSFPSAEVSAPIAQLIQPEVNTQLLTTPLNFSLFNSAQAANLPENNQIQTYDDLKNVDIKQTDPIRTIRQAQQPLEEQIIIKEELADKPETKKRPDLSEVYFVSETTGFIVGDNGTILKTEDGGQQWQLQTSGTNASLRSITFSSDSQQGWAVGNRGAVLKTTNGGLDWDYQTRTNTNLRSVTFLPGGQQGWIVGSSGQIILRTTDGGQNWQRQGSRSNSSLNAVTFLADGQQGWAVGIAGTILSTSNGGKSWERQSSGTNDSLNSVTFLANGQQGWAIGSFGTILNTSNGGQTWQRQFSGTNNSLNAVTFLANSEQGWAVGSFGTILSTSNGGESWEPQSKGRKTGLNAINFLIDGSQGWAVGLGGNILRRKGVKDWDAVDSGTNRSLRSVFFLADGQEGWAVGEGGIILKTENRGENWEPQFIDVSTTLDSITFTPNGEQGWVVGIGGTILSTNNGGQSWEPQSSGTRNSLFSVTFLADGQRGWAVGVDGVILNTRDGGRNWKSQVSTTNEWLMSVTFLDDGQQGWAVGYNGAILHTGDGGQNWRPQASGTDEWLMSVNFLTDGQRGWAVGAGGTILNTANGGRNWVLQNSSTNESIQSVTFLPNGKQGWATLLQGAILSTNNGGQTWQAIQYSRTPAYWFWFVCLSLFLLSLWLITKKPTASTQPQETVADLLASDRPLQPGDPDPLRFNAIALGLSRFMRNPATEPPLTVAITGAWGSGKSSLMNLLYHDLQSYGFTPVWFNAWHHQKGEQLLASLYANIKDQAIPSWFKFYKLMPVGLIFRSNLLAKRIKNHWLLAFISLLVSILVIQFVIETGFTWSDISPKKLQDDFFGKANGSIENLLILVLGGPIAILIRWLQAFGISPEKLMTGRTGAKKDNHKIDPSARQRFAKEFKDVSSCLDTGKMVIFIDDLDRCSKENVVDILEAMNFLSVSGDCYIVVGMDEAWVKVCINNHFPDMIENTNEKTSTPTLKKGFADHYLEKMINIPVPIPTLSPDNTLDLLLPKSQTTLPLSYFQKIQQKTMTLVRRYRVVLSLVVFIAMVSFITTISPQGLLSNTVEEKQATKVSKKFYEWNDVSIEQLTVVDGEPKIRLSLKEPATTPSDEWLPDPEKINHSSQLQLILEGQPDALKKGIKLAELGDENASASLILKTFDPNALNIEATSTQNISNAGEEAIKLDEQEDNESTGLIIGSQDIATYDYWLPISTIIFFVLCTIIYSLKIPNRFVDDSPRFKEALSIWQPWISMQRSTPRAIKRYINYVRYLAMRYKTPEVNENDNNNNEEEVHSQIVNEENLVGLSAIYAIAPEWLTDQQQLSLVREGGLERLVANKFDLDASLSTTQAITQSLTRSIDHHQQTFGNAIFNRATVKQFLEMNANTQFN